MNFPKPFRTAFLTHNYRWLLLNILPVISHKDAGSSLIRFSRKTKLVSCYGRFFHRQQFYKQCQAEIGKKIKQMLSKTLRLNFCYLKIIHILRPSYHAKIMGLTLKSKQKNKRVGIHESIQISVTKMKIKMKKRLQRYGINRPRSRHWHK